jgi:hypothetical protein
MAFEDKGALAYWAPTGLGYPNDHEIVGEQLFDEIFSRGTRALGPAVTNAKLRAYSTYGISVDLFQTLTLLGDPAGELALDRDGDELLDAREEEGGLDPLDADTDDDGLVDGLEPDPLGDTDGDGVPDSLDPDADNDTLPDGLEAGVETPAAGTDPSAGVFVADADPTTVTDPGQWDTDGGGSPDGAEDRSGDGAQDGGETDPSAGHGADDPACAPLPIPELDGPGVSGLRVSREGDDLRISWTDATPDRPCVLYRLYAAVDAPTKDCFCHYELLTTTAAHSHLHLDAATGAAFHDYLLVGFHPEDGEGELGHFGR